MNDEYEFEDTEGRVERAFIYKKEIVGAVDIIPGAGTTIEGVVLEQIASRINQDKADERKKLKGDRDEQPWVEGAYEFRHGPYQVSVKFGSFVDEG